MLHLNIKIRVFYLTRVFFLLIHKRKNPSGIFNAPTSALLERYLYGIRLLHIKFPGVKELIIKFKLH